MLDVSLSDSDDGPESLSECSIFAVRIGAKLNDHIIDKRFNEVPSEELRLKDMGTLPERCIGEVVVLNVLFD